MAPEAGVGCTAMFPLDGDVNARPNPPGPGKRRCRTQETREREGATGDAARLPKGRGERHRERLDQANGDVAPRKGSCRARRQVSAGLRSQRPAKSTWTDVRLLLSLAEDKAAAAVE